MREFADHHVDTPHGTSHAPISISVLLTALFLGVQAVIRIMVVVSTPVGAPATAYERGTPFAMISAAIAVLLLLFLAIDLRRNRIEAHGTERHQYAVFALAAALLLAFLWWLSVAGAFGVPAA